MTTKRKAVGVTLVGAVVAFMLAPQAPLGQAIWPAVVELDPSPTAVQEGLFLLLGVITALAFGGGIAFLLFAGPAVRDVVGPDRPALARALHLGTFWLLWNWWVHESLHMVVGLRAGGLLAIEYGFHVTMIAATMVVIYGLLELARDRVSRARASAIAR
jgi:hypothetical protein